VGLPELPKKLSTRKNQPGVDDEDDELRKVPSGRC
jgi:hypothetical protein